MSVLSPSIGAAVWKAMDEDQTVLILAHPCSGTRFACEYLRDEICGPGRHPDYRTRTVTHESGPVAGVTVVTVSFRFFPGAPEYDFYDQIWHLVRNPLDTVFSTSFKGNVAGIQTHLNIAEPSDDLLTSALMTVAAFNEKAAGLATHLFRVEDIPGERDPSHVHNHDRVQPTWDVLGKLNRKYAEKLYDQYVEYGYTDPPR